MLGSLASWTASLLVWLRRLAHAPSTRWAFFCVSGLLLIWPLLRHAGELNEFRDAQVLYAYEDVAVRTVREWFQLPLWNPYSCGGLYALGTPQSRFAAPPFLLSLLFGARRAEPLVALAMALLGMEGFFRYARMRTASALGPMLLAPLFSGNGFMAFSYFHGWLNFYGFLLLPWVLHGLDLALRGDRRGAIVVAASFGFIVGFGGTYAGPLAALLAVMHVLRCVAEKPARFKHAAPYRELAIALALSLCLSAFRLWPVIESLILAPRLMAGSPGERLAAFGQRLFVLSKPVDGNYGLSGQQFVGLNVIWLFVPGLLRRRAWYALAVGALCVWIATGYGYPHGAFGALRQLPVLHMLRYPERFLFLACLLGYEVAAQGVDLFLVLARKRARLFAPLVLVMTAFALMSQRDLIVNQRISAAGMWLGPTPLEIERPFAQARGNRWLAAHFVSISRGSLNCWEAYPLPMSPALRGDLPQEEYLTDPQSGTVERASWSPNLLELNVDLTRPGTVVINQNYHAGWHGSLGTVYSRDGLLAVDLPPGKHALSLRFRPRSALFGGAITLSGLVAAWALWRKRRRIALYAAGAVPLLLLGAFTLYDEPIPQAPAPRNADGSPVLVDDLPARARALDVKFALPIELAGAELQPSVGNGIARLALYWRVLGRMPSHVGISVHFESSKGRFITADHDAIGASFLPQRAPHDVLLRDVAAAVLDSAPDEHWRVYVCLWYTAGPPDRVKVERAGGATIDKDRVLVGEF